MNSKKFSEAMNELDDRYVVEAVNYKKKAGTFGWVKWGAMAACLCLVAVGAAVLLRQDFSSPDADGEGGAVGGNEGIMYSVAVYPAAESLENVASAGVVSLTESEALGNSLAKHLPGQLPEGFHYGRGSLYNTVMKDGTQYNMLRIEYISGEIPEQQFTEDGAAIAPNPETIGDVFIVCVMNYEPETHEKIYSSNEDITLSLLEEGGGVYIRSEDCYISVFVDTAEPAAVLEALKNIG